MRPLLKSLAMQVPFVREYVDRTRIVRRERDMLSEQVATLSKALHLPPAAATYGQAVVTDWSPAKARKQALSDAHLAVAASDRLTPLIEPVANHLNTVYAELVRHQVRAEPYWFQKLEVMPGLFSPGWSDPAKDKLPYYGLT